MAPSTVSKLLLRRIDPLGTTDRGELLKELWTKLKVPVLGMRAVAVGHNIILERKEDADKLLEEKGVALLKKHNLSVRVPPEIKARRSLFVRRVDSWVGAHTAEEIKQDLELNQPWLKIREIIKIKDYTHVFKIECVSVAMADRAAQEGLLCYFTRITSEQINRENYINLQLCFKCYKYESHSTETCPEGDIQWCSECGSKSHTFKDCPDDARKRCLNCGGAHRTMAMACRVKKERMKDKVQAREDKIQQEQNKTYSEIARTTAKTMAKETMMMKAPELVIDSGTELNVMVAIMHAHVMNIINKGVYEKELNNCLTAMNLPAIQVKGVPNSENLLNIKVTGNISEDSRREASSNERDLYLRRQEAAGERERTQTKQQQRQNRARQMEHQRQRADQVKKQHEHLVREGLQTTPQEAPSSEQQSKRQRYEEVEYSGPEMDTDASREELLEILRQSQMRSAAESRQRYSSVASIPEDAESIPTVERTEQVTTEVHWAGDIGLAFCADRSTVKRIRDMTSQDIKQLYNKGLIKYQTNHDCKYSEEQIKHYINSKLIRERGERLELLPSDEYKRRRNGRERTPPHEQQQRQQQRQTEARCE